MNWWLAYQILVALTVIVTLAWAFDARRLIGRLNRFVEMRDGPPTEEIELPPTMRIAPTSVETPEPPEDTAQNEFNRWAFESLGPGKPLPRVAPRDKWR